MFIMGLLGGDSISCFMLLLLIIDFVLLIGNKGKMNYCYYFGQDKLLLTLIKRCTWLSCN